MFARVWKWIAGVFRQRRSAPLKPVRFNRLESLKTHRWLLSVQGLDTHLLKSVKLPTVKPGARKGLNPYLSTMTLELYANVDSSMSANVLRWFNQGDRRRVDIKYLTSHGKVAEQWTMVVAPVEFKTTDLDYATSNQIVLTVKVQPFSMDIRGFNVID